jgi:succinate-semialdehyde dehydrogenase/glutarate-semialdehyde dehydrogenase
MPDTGVSLTEQAQAAGLKLIKEQAIIGARRVPVGRDFIEVDNPSTGRIIGAIPDLGAEDVQAAIQAAADAFPAWSRTPQVERAALMRRWAALIDENEVGLAAIMSIENGKPFEEAKGEVRYANSFIKWFAGIAESLHGETMESPTKGAVILSLKEPVGPAALITPWNFPAAMITRKVGPAFAAGCTVVIKPAHQTPFTAIALVDLALQAGIPEGVINLVTGQPAAVGEALTSSPLIRKLSFTGSTPVGRTLMAQCAPTLKRLSMELGGAAPLVVFEDADLELAVGETIKGKFRNSGQTCVCPNRVYVQRPLYDAYVEALTTAVAALKLGDAFEPEVKVGPLIDVKGLEKVKRHVAWAEAHGSVVKTGGSVAREEGLFFTPTVLAGGDDSLFREEETFGPVVPVFAFDSEDEAIQRCNASDFGLASYFFTRDLDRTMRIARQLEDGIVGMNTGLISNAAVPFGGVKQSGFGREGSLYGVDEYLSVKSVTMALR